MRLMVVGATTGSAAAINLIRSVMIKGIEGLTLECFLAASRAGVLDAVTTSLKNNYPGTPRSRTGRESKSYSIRPSAVTMSGALSATGNSVADCRDGAC
jgi:3-hydroxyisobutyrate dehydrogenase-like beta-hydroxyacid dehydrogenase